MIIDFSKCKYSIPQFSKLFFYLVLIRWQICSLIQCFLRLVSVRLTQSLCIYDKWIANVGSYLHIQSKSFVFSV